MQLRQPSLSRFRMAAAHFQDHASPCKENGTAAASRALRRSPAIHRFLGLADMTSPQWGSNPRPYAYEAHALPTELLMAAAADTQCLVTAVAARAPCDSLADPWLMPKLLAN
jgi:hypothetical protein